MPLPPPFIRARRARSFAAFAALRAFARLTPPSLAVFPTLFLEARFRRASIISKKAFFGSIRAPGTILTAAGTKPRGCTSHTTTSLWRLTSPRRWSTTTCREFLLPRRAASAGNTNQVIIHLLWCIIGDRQSPLKRTSGDEIGGLKKIPPKADFWKFSGLLLNN